MVRSVRILVGVAATSLLAACSEGKSASDAGKEAGQVTVDASFEPIDSGKQDAGADGEAGAALQAHCTQADFDAPAADFRQAGQVTIGVKPQSAPPVYTNNCAKITVGQKAVFSVGDFQIHPLREEESVPPNPIPRTNSGTQAITVTFTKVGEFGYHCTNHTSMVGAVKVVAP